MDRQEFLNLDDEGMRNLMTECFNQDTKNLEFLNSEMFSEKDISLFKKFYELGFSKAMVIITGLMEKEKKRI